jgi:hypothetical protein
LLKVAQMAFERSFVKLKQARLQSEDLFQARDVVTAQARFNAFLTAANAISNALQKEGKHLPGFKEWWATKRAEMTGDELLRYVHKRREEGYHEANDPIAGAMHLIVQPFDEGAPPPPTLPTVISEKGAFWIADKGGPGERRIPIPSANWTTKFVLRDAPSSHLGQPIESDLTMICALSLDYYAALVVEAQSKWP